MKKFFKWLAVAIGALITLAVLENSADLTRYFVALTGVVVYCFWHLSKQVQANHESMVRRTDMLFKLARGRSDDEEL